jgi:hypothetical protein
VPSDSNRPRGFRFFLLPEQGDILGVRSHKSCFAECVLAVAQNGYFAIGGLEAIAHRAISKRSLPDRCIEPLDLWMYIHDSCGEQHKTSRKLSALMKRGEARIGAGQRSYTRLDHSDILGISLLVEAAEQVAARNTVCEPGNNCGSRVSGQPGFRRYRKRQRFGGNEQDKLPL